jgi:hypothetical protein
VRVSKRLATAALHFLIDACMKAADVADDRALFKHVEVDFISKKILESYPQLGREPLSDLIGQRR